MATVASQGVTFKIGDGGTPTETFNTVGEVTTISGLRGGSAQVIDVSTLASTRREKIMGLPDEGQITVGLNYDPVDARQGDLETARSNRALTNFQIELSNTPATVFAFSGYVLSFSVDAGVDTVVTGQVTIEITGAVTKT